MVATDFRPGSPRAALAHPAFRWVFVGSFASNIGTWMQNVVLISFADQLTGNASYVGLVTLAQLGPTLLLAPFGGVLADIANRRVVMMVSAGIQGCLSGALALVVSSSQPSRSAIVWCVLGIGIAAAATMPSATASLPALVGRVDLAGAVSLNSAQMNASRVFGPLLVLLPFFDSPATVFAINAATYLFVIAAVAIAPFDGRPVRSDAPEGPWTRFVGGLTAARDHRVVRRCLVTVSVFSFWSLAFIYQMPGFARQELGIERDRFPVLFGTFGFGAAVGAICVGTLLAHVPRTTAVRAGLAGFATMLTAFAVAPNRPVAFVAVGLCGFAYFVVITSLSTALQQAVEDSVRGRVMGLWMMGWAGLVPVGSQLAGVAIDQVGHIPVFLVGAVIAACLIPYASLEDPTATASTNGGPPHQR